MRPASFRLAADARALATQDDGAPQIALSSRMYRHGASASLARTDALFPLDGDVPLGLRQAAQTEADTVADIIRRSFATQADELGIGPDDSPNYVAFETAERVLRRMEGGESVVLGYSGREAVGTVSYRVTSEEDREGAISRLAVVPGRRGNQLGLALMSFAEERLREEHVESVEISIVAQFARLRQYYEMQGYVAQETEWFPTLPFEVLFLVKSLEQR